MLNSSAIRKFDDHGTTFASIMPQALYLKYRPRTFDEVQGQEHVTRTLKNALRLGRVAHAYLFTGPRGTGKTSTARILAKAVNCTSTTKEHPCNECPTCRAINEERLLDLIEIDAASNTGVDDIRELRDKIDFRPNEAKYKVYIIDEAHMLSTAAFNALLKTLEEPPPHVIFVLATTEPNRIPPTITSRCQRFDFRRATVEELKSQLSNIATKEGLEVESAAVELIARQATGSFRDGTSLLDQLVAFGSGAITQKQVQALLGAASHETIRSLATSIAKRELGNGIHLITQAIDAGADPRQLARELIDYLRGILLLKTAGGVALTVNAETRQEMSSLANEMSAEDILRTIRLFNTATFELRSSANPTLPLEMALVESTLQSDTAISTTSSTVKREAVPRTGAGVPTRQEPPTPASPARRGKSTPTDRAVEHSAAEDTSNAKLQAPIGVTLLAVQEHWQPMLTRLRKVNKSTEALLRDAQPVGLDGNLITIGFFYELHKSRVETDKHAKTQIEKIFTEIFSTPLLVRCVVSAKKQKMKAAQDDPVVRAALNLGGKITDVS